MQCPYRHFICRDEIQHAITARLNGSFGEVRGHGLVKHAMRDAAEEKENEKLDMGREPPIPQGINTVEYVYVSRALSKIRHLLSFFTDTFREIVSCVYVP
jgi:hypothetical protein